MPLVVLQSKFLGYFISQVRSKSSSEQIEFRFDTPTDVSLSLRDATTSWETPDFRSMLDQTVSINFTHRHEWETKRKKKSNVWLKKFVSEEFEDWFALMPNKTKTRIPSKTIDKEHNEVKKEFFIGTLFFFFCGRKKTKSPRKSFLWFLFCYARWNFFIIFFRRFRFDWSFSADWNHLRTERARSICF